MVIVAVNVTFAGGASRSPHDAPTIHRVFLRTCSACGFIGLVAKVSEKDAVNNGPYPFMGRWDGSALLFDHNFIQVIFI